MDLTTLLAHCLVSDNNLRQEADLAIRNTPNGAILPQLLTLLASDGVVDISIKVLAFTIVKTRVKSHWFVRDSQSPNFIDPSVKFQVKTSLGQLLYDIQDPFNEILLINQLMDNIHLILSYEIGEEHAENSLQSILIQVGGKMAQGQLQDLQAKHYYVNILVIQSIAKCNKFSLESLPLLNEIGRTFNPWYKLGIQNGFNCTNQIHLNKIKYNLFKLYQYLTIMTIPDCICDEGELKFWTDQIIASFSALDPAVSKWGLKVILNIFKKVSHANNSKLDVQFVNYLSSQLTCEIIYNILSAHLNELCQNVKVSDQLTQLLMISVLNANTYQQVKPHLEPIINSLVIPQMTITQDEVDEFEDEPISFTNRLNNDSDTIYQQFIKLLVSHDVELKQPLFELTLNLLHSGTDLTISCGLSLVVCILQGLTPEQLDQMVRLVLGINEGIQTNDRLWLRCGIYEMLTHVSDTGLPVAITDQMPLPLLIASLKLLIFKQMEYNVVEVMSILLQISSTYPLEIVYELIDLVVLQHPDEIQPFNLDLIDKLTQNFVAIYQSGGVEAEENMDQLANIMNNFVTIVISINDPASFGVINERVAKVVEIIMTNGILDILAEAMELLETINYMTKKVLNLEMVIESFHRFGVDYPDLFQVYFESVYQYGDGDDVRRMNECVLWIYSEQLHVEDFELNEVVLSLMCQMAIHPAVEAGDELSSEVLTRTLQASFELIEDRDRFFENKLVLRCVIACMIHKMPLVGKLFGAQLKGVLNALDVLINKRQWSTVFDLRLGTLGLCALAKSSLMENEIKAQTMGLIIGMVNRLEPAIEHRMQLLHMEQGTAATLGEDVEVTFDEEYDEINKETRIDGLNVVEIVRATLHLG